MDMTILRKRLILLFAVKYVRSGKRKRNCKRNFK